MNFLRKHQKKLLAIFASFLMIVFILPNALRPSPQSRNTLMGHLGDEKIYAENIRASQLEWDALKHVLIQGNNPQERWVPIVQVMFSPQTLEQFEEHPAMFYLLEREAKKIGAQPNEQAMQELLQTAATPSGDGRLLPIEQADNADLLRQAIVDLLTVQGSFNQQRDLVKLSEPVRQYELATQGQQISTDLVEFKSSDFANRVQNPTTQQLQEQFTKYADKEPASTTSASDPFGFGYRYPDRVKLQYLSVSRDEVKKYVKAKKDDYLWQVDAQRYYLEHQSQFQTTPATQASTTRPTSQASTGPSTRAVASTQPTTKPFAEVRDEAMRAVLDPQVDELQTDIINRIRSRMTQDWMAYHTAVGSTTAPTTATASAASKPAPMTAYGVPFDSYEYLQKLAADIQKQTGVLPTVASIADTFKDDKQLEALAGIGQSLQENIPFSMYATRLAEPFMNGQKSDRSIAIWQPSQVLRDMRENDYVFRLTAVDPSHKPASLDEVKAAVEADWKKAQAYELAKAQAKQVMESAAKSNLSNAAIGAGKMITTTGPFANRPTVEIPNYEVDPSAKANFLEQAFNLLTLANQKNPHPTSLIELPAAGKVLVAQLEDVKPAWRNDDMMAMAGDIFSQQIAHELEIEIYNHWFNYNELATRVGYHEENPKKNETASASVQ